MKKLLLIALLLVSVSFGLKANGCFFYASGGQLIPGIETEISVKKEILTLKRTGSFRLSVDVYYEFYNPTSYSRLCDSCAQFGGLLR